MDYQKCCIISWNVDGLGGKHRKYLVRNWIKTLPISPLVISLHELKSSPFLIIVAFNIIAPNYKRVISKVDKGKGDTTLLFHPFLSLIDSGTLSLGRAAWAQFQLDTMVLSIAIIYVPSDSSWAKAYLWH